MSRHLGFDLRSIIHDIKDISKRDIHSIALHIHIALEYNSPKHLMDRPKYHNRLLEIFQSSRQYRKRNDF